MHFSLLKHRAAEFLKHRWRAVGRHGIHSPLVFDFVEKVIKGKQPCPEVHAEAVRQEMLRNRTSFQRKDFGAGSVKKTPDTVRKIAQTSLQGKKFAQILGRTAAWLQPKTIVEFGTSLGITTIYLHTCAPEAQLITFEGDPFLADLAEKNLRKCGSAGKVICGKFEESFPDIKGLIQNPALFYVDGHHIYEATLKLVDMVIPLCSEGSIIVIDDIHWSQGMSRAWKELVKKEEFGYTCDLYKLGYLFVSPARVKQHFILKT